MTKIGSLQIIHFVEQQLEGWTFSREHWPLHLTLVPWFTVQDHEAIIRSLDRLADEVSPLTLAVGVHDNLGQDAEVPVNLIANQEPVLELHNKLEDTLSGADSTYIDQRSANQNYVPHITRHDVDNRHSNEGEDIVVNDFHLVRLIDEKTCRVERQFDLIRS